MRCPGSPPARAWLRPEATHVDAQGQVQVGDEAPDLPLLKTVNGLLNPTTEHRTGATTLANR